MRPTHTLFCLFLFEDIKEVNNLRSFERSEFERKNRIQHTTNGFKGICLQNFRGKSTSCMQLQMRRDITCQSFNYVAETKSCELNNRTKEARPDNFIPDPARFYIRRLNNRGIERLTQNQLTGIDFS